jgi:plastocyanin
MDYENRTADYSTTHTITLRNQIFNDSDLETMYDDYIYTEEDKVTDITLSPTMVDARPGETVTFSYAVSASGSTPDRSVTFSVQNNTSANTTIDGSGVLTIGADETASSLTVICQSNSDTSISRTAVVNIAKVTAVALTTTDLPPYEDMYYFPGAELNFTASVEGNYITETGKSVTWSISDEKNSAKITASTGNSCTVDVGDAIDQTITLTATSVLDRTVSASYIIRVADIDTGALYVRSDTGFFTLKRDGSLQLSAYINDDSVTSSGVTFTWEIVDDPTGGKVSINDNGYLTAEKNIPYDKSYSVRVKVTANSTSSSQTEVTAEVTVTIDKVEISFTPASAIVVVGSTTRVTTEVKGLNVDMKEISITYKPAVKGFSALMSSNGTLVLGEEKKYKDTAVVTASLSNGGKVTADLTVHFRESNIIVDGQNGCYAPVPGDGGLFPDGDDDGIPDATTSIDIKGVTYTYVLEANNKWYLTVNGVKYNYNKNSTTDIKYVKAK